MHQLGTGMVAAPTARLDAEPYQKIWLSSVSA
jgi:hypothetical protein